jgi:hypothetical protein
MTVTVTSNNQSVVHKASSGVTFVFPDVCVTPAATANMTTPLPYPSFAGTAITRQKQLTQKGAVGVKTSAIKTPTGDEAGSSGSGVISNRIKGKTQFMQYSFDVKYEGSPVVRHEITQLHNALNQVNAQLQNMTSRDPDVWQRLLQEYIVSVSALYMTLKDDD